MSWDNKKLNCDALMRKLFLNFHLPSHTCIIRYQFSFLPRKKLKKNHDANDEFSPNPFPYLRLMPTCWIMNEKFLLPNFQFWHQKFINGGFFVNFCKIFNVNMTQNSSLSCWIFYSTWHNLSDSLFFPLAWISSKIEEKLIYEE